MHIFRLVILKYYPHIQQFIIHLHFPTNVKLKIAKINKTGSLSIGDDDAFPHLLIGDAKFIDIDDIRS